MDSWEAVSPVVETLQRRGHLLPVFIAGEGLILPKYVYTKHRIAL